MTLLLCVRCGAIALHSSEDCPHSAAEAALLLAKSRPKTFDEYVAKGFTMYRLKKGGDKGRKITEFEPDARSILAVPRMVGG